MSLKSESEEDLPLKPKELIFLLAIAGRIDAQTRLLAQKLDKERYIYHGYAILDSLSSSYSMFKYFFEVFISNGDADLMHKILTSPEGIAAITAETLFLVSFSFFASLYDNEEKDNVKKFIVAAWPYFRDVMKGLKNAYKGWRSTVQLMGVLSGMDLKYMAIPVGIILGIFSASIRFWLRDMVERRKNDKKENEKILLEIQGLPSLTDIDETFYLGRIKYQNENERRHAYFAVAAGGVIDGLYLYIGVVSLSAFVPPLFIVMTVFSAMYVLACVVTRIYEEYNFQLDLEITQTKCKREFFAKKLKASYAQLFDPSKISDSSNNKQKLKEEIGELFIKFKQEHDELQKQLTHSYLTAGLLGMKYGLYGYGAVTSCLFMVSALFLVSATAFPPALLTAFVVSGFVLMMGFTIYTLRSHYLHLQEQEKGEYETKEKQSFSQLSNMIAIGHETHLSAEAFGQKVENSFVLNPSPQFLIQERCEVLRSVTSGSSKGYSFSNFVTTSLQDIDADGHHHDHPAINILAATSVGLFSGTLGLRALARGLGRTPSGQMNSPPPSSPLLTTTSTRVTMNDVKKEETPMDGDASRKPKKLVKNTLTSSFPTLSSFVNRFFSDPPPLPRSTSAPALGRLNGTTRG